MLPTLLMDRNHELNTHNSWNNIPMNKNSFDTLNGPGVIGEVINTSQLFSR